MAEYKLHCFAQSGNSYKVALMLELAGADWEPVWVDFFHGATRTPALLELNEMGEVPVLEHHDLVLTQSGVILDYLAQRYRDAGLRDVELVLYPQARHELLNETNRDEVTARIVGFLDRTVGA